MIYPTIYTAKTPYGNYQVLIELNKYVNNNCLAIQLKDAQTYEPIAKITVNLNYYLEDNEAYIDINNYPWAADFIEENKLGENLHEDGVSGYCRYPKYRFDLHKITALSKEE